MIQSRTALAVFTFIIQLIFFSALSAQCPELESINEIYNCQDGSTTVIIELFEPEGIQYSIDGGVTFQDSKVFANKEHGDYVIVISDGVSCTDFYSIQIVERVLPAGGEELGLEISYNCSSEIILSADGFFGNNGWYRNGELLLGEYTSELRINKDSEEGEYTFQSTKCRNSEPYFLDKEALGYYLNPEDQNIDCVFVTDLVTYSITVRDALPGQNDGRLEINLDSAEPFVFSTDGGSSFNGCNVFENLEAGRHVIIVSNGVECMEVEIEIPEFNSTNTAPLNVAGGICVGVFLKIEDPDANNIRWYKNDLVLDGEIGNSFRVSKFNSETGDNYNASYSSPQGGFTTEKYEVEFKEYFTDLGTKFICEGDTTTVNGFPFPLYRDGTLNFKTYASDGCDSTIAITVVVLSDTQCDKSFMSGSLFYDENKNGFHDHNERGVPDVPLKIAPQDLTLFVPYHGLFYHLGEEGVAYNISVDLSNEPVGKWEITTPESAYSIVFDKDNPDHKSLNIGLVHKEDFYDGRLSMSPFGSRCNQEEEVDIYFRNLGTEIGEDEILTISLELDPKYTLLESKPMPTSQVNNIYSYEFSDLKSYEQTGIDLLLESPDETHTGEIYNIKSSATLVNSNGDEIVIANYEKEDIVRCSYDPNDKQVSPMGVDDEQYTLIGEKLTYTVRFQNTGNDVAYDVRINDVLDENLDLSTFRIVGSSHEMTTSLSRNVVEFLFKNIQLPDSTSNEPLSHGYVIYEVEPRGNIVDNTLITNTADIFFDLNPPIVTNTTRSLMVESLPTSSVLELDYLSFDATLKGDEVLLDWTLVRNGRIDNFIIERSSDRNDWQVLGSLDYKQSVAIGSYQYTDTNPHDGTNYYRIQQVLRTGGYEYSKIRSVEVPLTDNFDLFPNPISRGELLTIQSKSGNLQKCTISDKLGKTVMQRDVKAGQETLTIAKLLPGIYLCELQSIGVRKTFRLVVY